MFSRRGVVADMIINIVHFGLYPCYMIAQKVPTPDHVSVVPHELFVAITRPALHASIVGKAVRFPLVPPRRDGAVNVELVSDPQVSVLTQFCVR